MKQIIYNTFILDKINRIIGLSKFKTHNTNCKKCNLIFNKSYIFENVIITDLDLHEYILHGVIDINLYEKICTTDLKNYNINFFKIHTNDLNIMDGLYNIGSNKIYIDFNKNIKETNNTKFSEHFGFINFEVGKFSNVTVLNKMNLENDDFYTPQNVIDFSTKEYIFHTHPVINGIGNRCFIIYEIPSINDILHFINYHNLGILKCSVVITSEGLYCIRKNKWNNEKIKIDKNIFIKKINGVIDECEKIITNNFSHKKITYNYFYKKIMPNIEIIKLLNTELEFFNITIDFYGRNLLKNKYVLSNIYLPN